MFASSSRSPARDGFAAAERSPARLADLAVCALLALVTVGLLVSAM